MSDAKQAAPRPLIEVVASVRRLPDLRAAIEALLLFLVVVAAGVWAAMSDVFTLDPVPRDSMLILSVSAFLMPALSEELAFRGWVRAGAPIAAVISLLAYVFWHPFQVMANLPFARPEFTDPRFLIVVATLGACCTLSRIRSGSIWPAVVIHWGAAVVWRALFAGAPGAAPV